MSLQYFEEKNIFLSQYRDQKCLVCNGPYSYCMHGVNMQCMVQIFGIYEPYLCNYCDHSTGKLKTYVLHNFDSKRNQKGQFL
jgi:hypothetical protein